MVGGVFEFILLPVKAAKAPSPPAPLPLAGEGSKSDISLFVGEEEETWLSLFVEKAVIFPLSMFTAHAQ